MYKPETVILDSIVIDELSLLRLEELTYDCRLLGCYQDADLKDVGELYLLGKDGRYSLPKYGRKCEAIFQQLLFSYLSQRAAIFVESGITLSKNASAQEISEAFGWACAALYQKKSRGKDFSSYAVEYEVGESHALQQVLLRKANISVLIKALNINGLNPQVQATDKDSLLNSLDPAVSRAVEVELYKVARSLLSIVEWGPILWNQYIPSFVLSSHLEVQGLNGHIRRAIRPTGIRTYQDFLSIDPLDLTGVGRRSFFLLLEKLDEFVLVDSLNLFLSEAEIKGRPILELLQEAASSLNNQTRSAESFSLLLGFEAERPLSINEAADRLRVTREAIIQFEKLAWKKTQLKNKYWMTLMVRLLERALEFYSGKIFLRDLEQTEPWFSPVIRQPKVFGRILKNLPWTQGQVRIYRNGGETFLRRQSKSFNQPA